MVHWTPDADAVVRFRDLLDRAQDCVEDLLWLLQELESMPQVFPPTQPPSFRLGVFTDEKIAWLKNLQETLAFLEKDLSHVQS